MNTFANFVNITYNGEVHTVKKNSTFMENFPYDKNAIAIQIDNEIARLDEKLRYNSTINTIDPSSSVGMNIYRRSLTFLLAKVVSEIFPNNRLHIGHSLGPGYYFDLDGVELTEQALNQIKCAMQEQVAANKPIIKDVLSYSQAINYLKKHGRLDKVNLLNGINNSFVTFYYCDEYMEIFDKPLAMSTGILSVFDIIKYQNGFIIQFPQKSDLSKPATFVPQNTIFSIYNKSKQISHSLHVDNIGDLNNLIMNNQISEFVQISEYLQYQNILDLAQQIVANKEKLKLITIAGPSSSGKTTFSKRLSLQLKTLGLTPVTISIDDYYCDREQTPRDENGNYDFECLEALNIQMLNDHLSNLIKGQNVHLPIFNFHTGKSSLRDESVKLNPNEILVIEGIHGLNDKLTYSISTENKYKIYISALTQINIDDNNRIPTTDNRLIRRIVRDYKYRGYSAAKTISMWQSVRNGEEKHIFPFQNTANGYFNSALNYELAALKPYIEPLLLQIKPDEIEYAEARRLLRFLQYFMSIDSSMIPTTSLIREFIGGSFFNY